MDSAARRSQQGVTRFAQYPWRNALFRGYADDTVTPAFAEGLAELLELAAGKHTTMMCAEVGWRRCQRLIVSDVLKLRGIEVVARKLDSKASCGWHWRRSLAHRWASSMLKCTISTPLESWPSLPIEN